MEQQFHTWLQNNNRAGYIPAYDSIVKDEATNTLSWCDFDDLKAIFLNLKATADPNYYSVDDLNAIFTNLSVNKTTSTSTTTTTTATTTTSQ
jgi:hypothetical protein